MIVVAKRERAIVMETLLKKLGCNVVIVLSIYDAVKQINQDMPHMVICDSELPDGSAAMLYDRLQTQDLFRNLPVMVSVVKRQEKS